MFLGGVLTEYASWPWVFYLNIPVAVAVIAIATRVMPDVPGSRGSQDWVGAATVTGGLAALVYAIVRAPEVGWASAQTLGVGAGALLALGIGHGTVDRGLLREDLAGLLARYSGRALGEIALGPAIDAVAATIGAMAPRKAGATPPPPVRFPAHVDRPVVRTHSGQPNQAAAAIAWPTGAGSAARWRPNCSSWGRITS